ncbi:hypothetical protein OG369_09910 [Streptomyces sp. NBC_01221]|uniref:hypothetical protein n=1 Tax=Streptomyces sp. NBC_01221 TaxID=2903782 RepID=UPI0022538DA9|nr:hypothetical protein [Streptomyces sp. NBC_01221]MCX4786486.1 hypothetical protein [Streptomyces sp. NBC_01221]
MEILLIACMLAYAAGSQSEQSKLGLSPAQRAVMREQTRHEKAIQRIAEKHGGTAPPKNGVSPWKEAPASGVEAATPETFWSGYRNRRPAEHTGRPIGHRAGTWTAQGVTWAQDTGRGAWQAYRKRRQEAGRDEPGPVLVPLPSPRPPLVPPIPASPPTVGVDSDKSAAPAKAEESPKKGDEDPAKEPAVDLKKAPKETPASPNKPAVDTAPETDQDDTTPPSTPQPAGTPEGVGRMAAEVTYESVMDESDELSIMCDDDVRVYDRIRTRAEREIGRGDALIAALEATGFGPSVIGWVARCKENYQVIHSQIDDLQANTIAQGEAVVKAKALLEAGQGVYADIAKDMEDVAERDAYISDAVDAEDASAHTEVYETKAA